MTRMVIELYTGKEVRPWLTGLTSCYDPEVVYSVQPVQLQYTTNATSTTNVTSTTSATTVQLQYN